MDAVILGNGEYPTHSMPETMLIMAPYVVCCDGSADEHIRRGFTPDAIIGDGDSLSPENKERFRTIFHQIDDQETNDQTKAVHFLLDQGKKNNHPRGCNRQTGRPYPGKHQSADRLYESRSPGNDADGPWNVYSCIGTELFQVISRTANLHLQLQRHRTEGRWAGISTQ